jgi:hypothetical protein
MRGHIEIGGFTTDPAGKVISNWQIRAFVFDGVPCAGFEGLVQAFKCPHTEEQRAICKLPGKEAWRAGQKWNTWKETQTLHWQGDTFKRTSRGYMLLIERAYTAIYEQDETFRRDLLALGSEDIQHSIGKSDTSQTTLTEAEMLNNIQRLRIRALYDSLAALKIR